MRRSRARTAGTSSQALEFTEEAIRGGGVVFVHCQHGVSRSATLVIAYLMWRQALPYEEALDHVRAARPTINPNIGFACALMAWGAALAPPPGSLQAWSLQPLAAATPAAAPSLLSEPRRAAACTMRHLPAAKAELLRGPHAASSVYLFVRGGVGHMWHGGSCPAALRAQSELEVHLGRLRTFHGVEGAVGAEAEGRETESFWQMVRGPAMQPEAGGGAMAVEVEMPPPPVPSAMPPPSCAKARRGAAAGAARGGGFGGGFGAEAGSATAAGRADAARGSGGGGLETQLLLVAALQTVSSYLLLGLHRAGGGAHASAGTFGGGHCWRPR